MSQNKLTRYLMLLICLTLFSCQESVVMEAELSPDFTITDRSGKQLETEPYLILYGVFYQTALDSDTVFIPNGRITSIDQSGFGDEISYDEHGYYVVEMQFDNKYTILYEAEGHYSKHIEIDTHNIPDSIRGEGYLMPTDMTLPLNENEKVQELLENSPIGKASFMESKQDFDWDFVYTDSVKKLIEKLEN